MPSDNDNDKRRRRAGVEPRLPPARALTLEEREEEQVRNLVRDAAQRTPHRNADLDLLLRRLHGRDLFALGLLVLALDTRRR